jgi:acetyl-CoA acyltransferase
MEKFSWEPAAPGRKQMAEKKRDAVIVAYGRSAVCKAKKGSFAAYHPVEWSAQVLSGVLKKASRLDMTEISDVLVGCSAPVNELGSNTARLISLRAGLPEFVSAQTVNRFCASGLQTIASCANAILAEQEEILIAGGVEDMSKTFGIADPKYRDSWFNDNYPGAYMSMGLTAENVASLYGLSRQEMEALAIESHMRAYRAQQSGFLNKSIIPVEVPDGAAHKIITQDEGIRPDTNAERLGELKPCFKEDGLITAATSSQTSDAAAFAVLMSGEKAKALKLRPLARFVSFAVSGCAADKMGLGPVYAVPKAMRKSGLMIKDMDVIELNEAFAAQVIPCIKELKLDKEKVNPWGGAMALGHPMGATGAILLCKALDYLELTKGRYALVTMCVGGGMGAAGIFERMDHQEETAWQTCSV